MKTEDALAVDWTTTPPWQAEPVRVEGGTTIAWVMSPPSPNSGGHQNLFRFIAAAEAAGHRCRVYFYTSSGVVVDSDDMRRMLMASGGYPPFKASLAMYDPARGVDDDVQAIFATGWETAYPVFRDSSAARRFYFVQDFEPAFYPVGSESLLAENTYRFGFHGITAGGWLARKLADEYGMTTDHFDFAVDRSTYHMTSEKRRREVFFYARPMTPRRGFELGVMALSVFAERHPDVRINLAGGAVDLSSLPFRAVDHAEVNVDRLNRLYNRCAVALVLSATNMSLLPLELASAGVIPIVNDGPNNRLVSDNPFIEYVPPVPRLLGERLITAFERPDAVAHARAMSDSLAGADWAASGRQFVDAFERAMHG
ncbi:rhamnosyltransferase WsaF family glycosyltransferase [Agromyces bauzanensis]